MTFLFVRTVVEFRDFCRFRLAPAESLIALTVPYRVAGTFPCNLGIAQAHDDLCENLLAYWKVVLTRRVLTQPPNNGVILRRATGACTTPFLPPATDDAHALPSIVPLLFPHQESFEFLLSFMQTIV